MSETPSGWVQPGGSEGPDDGQPGWGGQPAPGWGRQSGWGGQPAQGWGAPPPPDVQPGVIPLRPLGIGELLDGAIAIVRSYPRATLGLSSIVVVATQLISLGLTAPFLGDLRSLEQTGLPSDSTDPEQVFTALGGFLGANLAAQALTALGLLVLTGMLTAVVGKAVLGRPVTLREAWLEVRPQLLRLVAVALLTFLIVIGCILVGAGVGLALLVVGRPVALGVTLAVLGGLAGAAVGAFLYVLLALSTPALVLERQTVFGALRRSRQLVRGSWWRVLGVLLLATLVAGTLGVVLRLPFQFLGSGTPFDPTKAGNVTFTGLLIATLGAIIAQTIVSPFSAGVTALLYVDRRMRAEGLDVTLTAAAAAQ